MWTSIIFTCSLCNRCPLRRPSWSEDRTQLCEIVQTHTTQAHGSGQQSSESLQHTIARLLPVVYFVTALDCTHLASRFTFRSRCIIITPLVFYCKHALKKIQHAFKLDANFCASRKKMLDCCAQFWLNLLAVFQVENLRYGSPTPF